VAGDTGVVPDLSVVLPSYRAAALAARSVGRLREFLQNRKLSWEIVVVDDGGGDFVGSEWVTDARVRLVSLPRNRGKGAAVCAGMLAALGDVRVFTDVDLPYGVELLPTIIHYVKERGFHLVIGDRTLPESLYRTEISWKRRLASAVYSDFVGRLVTGGFFDTQCGLKGVRGDVADHIFALLRVERFAFDVELVYVALKHRLDIKRIPVRLLNNETSSVRLLRDATRGLADILGIKLRQMRGAYASPTLDEILRRDFTAASEAALSRDKVSK
jgi:glycosyltransferase involved in cell wall biosynthesis